MRWCTRAAVGVVAVGVGAGLSACSSGSGPAAAGTAGPATVAASSPVSSSAAASSAAGAATPAASPTSAPSRPTVPRCTAGQLAVRLGSTDGAAGSIYVPVVFHNTGSRCELDGHPGMDATGPDGTVHAARDGRSSTGSTAVRRVVLAPGGDASALVRASDVPTGTAACPAAFTSVLVTPPDLTRSTRLTADLPACPGLAIGPVVPGTAG